MTGAAWSVMSERLYWLKRWQPRVLSFQTVEITKEKWWT
jgi:hypothetical protein